MKQLRFQKIVFDKMTAMRTKVCWFELLLAKVFTLTLTVGLNIFYLYTLYIEQHIKTYNTIQYTNGIQKKVFRLKRICIPFKLSSLLILSRFREKNHFCTNANFGTQMYYESLETFQLEV